MSAQARARQLGGCGEVIDVAAWCDGDAVPSTAGLCASPAMHTVHRAAAGHAHAARIAQQARLHTGRWTRAGAMDVRLA